jgi:hypothetical protein
MTEWKLSKRQPTCRACSREFADGEAHLSSLAIRGEELAREDHCITCWKKHDSQHEIFWWRTRHSVDKRRALALDLGALEALFVRLEDRQEVALLELRYVLCLVLMRKRRLKIERVERDGENESLVVSRPKRAEHFRVAVFDFAPDKLDELRARLQEVFEGSEGDALASDSGAVQASGADPGVMA